MCGFFAHFNPSHTYNEIKVLPLIQQTLFALLLLLLLQRAAIVVGCVCLSFFFFSVFQLPIRLVASLVAVCSPRRQKEKRAISSPDLPLLSKYKRGADLLDTYISW